MNREELFEVMEDIDERHVKAAREPLPKRKPPVWVKWGAFAACLCLVLWGAVVLRPDSPGSNVPVNDAATPPVTMVDGISYMSSSYFTSYSTCPEGFSFAGEIRGGEFAGSPYYTNPDVWEYIYLLLDGRAEGSKVYIRFVAEDIRGKRYVSYNGQLYISMASAEYWGEHPDTTAEQFELIRKTYGIRIEGETVDGFVSAGVAEFSGYDTVPTGDLACNTAETEVFVNPQDDTVILLPTWWYTHTAEETQETRHTGFIVYMKLEE